jgi:hypothetical protein
MNHKARELLERERARLLVEAAAKAAEAEAAAAKAAEVERDMADLDRIMAKYMTADSDAPLSPLTIADLAERYRTDERSPYQTVRSSSRKTYDKLIKSLIQHCGPSKVADLAVQDKIQALYEKCVAGDKIAMAHALMTKLRGLAHFGMNVLEDTDCKNVAFILHTMTFPTVKSRKEGLTVEQAENIRVKAHELGLHSIALAQAFQFECRLTQKDVIGEWVPITDSTKSQITGIIRGSEKWVRGLCHNEISDDWILRHTPSAGGNDIEIDLKNFPVVMDELTAEIRRLGKRPKSGPIIVKDDTREPYAENTFRYLWRKVATATGVPKKIHNRDSRPTAQRNKWEPESRMGVKK